MAQAGPAKFVRQVRQEIAKVIWPSRRETVITTVMVMVFVVIAALFFLAADQLIGWAVGLLIGLGG